MQMTGEAPKLVLASSFLRSFRKGPEDVPLIDTAKFFAAWLRNPLATAAIAPTGSSIARLITREIEPGIGPIIELGPGTGVFTRLMLERGVDAHDLILVEFNPDFVSLLHKRFPRVTVILADATQLAQLELVEPGSCNRVVSGLGLLSMSDEQVEGVLRGSFHYLAQAGKFYQFTYAMRCPVKTGILERLGLKSQEIGRSFRNIPPASVHRLQRITSEHI
jgi:phosphatidylethanolamine/phosphatidyl-N-methylethanolamine N-methyltransferase